jgi:hypothetical protein
VPHATPPLLVVCQQLLQVVAVVLVLPAPLASCTSCFQALLITHVTLMAQQLLLLLLLSCCCCICHSIQIFQACCSGCAPAATPAPAAQALLYCSSTCCCVCVHICHAAIAQAAQVLLIP